MIPVDRDGGRGGVAALMTGRQVLEEGKAFSIYPEGTRSPDGRLYRGKTGVARLALESGAPVIPTAMVGTFEFMPSGRLRPRLRIRPGVRFGKPLDFSRYAGLESDRMVLRAVTDEIMYALMELAGQEYVDEYAQRAKSRVKKSDSSLDPALPGAPASSPASQAQSDDDGGVSVTATEEAREL